MAPLVHQPLDQAEPVVLVVDGELTGEPEQLGLAPKQPRGERVERADPESRRIAAEQPPDPVLHLAGGLVGEGDREDPIGRHAVPLDQRGDPGGEYARLARPRAGEHQHGTVHVLHRLLLGGIEGVRQLGRRRVDHPVGRSSGMRIRKQAPFSVAPAPACRGVRPRPRAATARGRCPSHPRLVVMPGSKRVRRISLGTPGPVVHDPDLAHAFIGSDSQDNRPATSLQRVDRVLHQRLQRPLQQHGIADHSGAGARRFQLELDRIRPLRQARAEVAAHSVRQRAEPDRLALGRIADALEPAGHAVQPLGVGREVVGQIGRRGRSRAHSLDPSLETGERRAHLMRRLARHRHPQAVALRGHGTAVGEHGHRDHHHDRERLEDREGRDVALRREQVRSARCRWHPRWAGSAGRASRA